MNEETQRLVSWMIGRPVTRVSELTPVEIEACLNLWAMRQSSPASPAYEYAWAHLGVDSLSEMGRAGWRVVPNTFLVPPSTLPTSSADALCVLMERAL